MATNYPGALDTFTNPVSGDSMASATVPHATQHTNANDAIAAIETELGINPKGSFSSVAAAIAGKANTSHTHAAGDIISGVLTPLYGGTGLSSVTSGYFLRGGGGGSLATSTPAQVLSDIGAMSGTIIPNGTLTSASPGSSYPYGVSTLSLTPAQISAGSWPALNGSGDYAVVLTISADNAAGVSQWIMSAMSGGSNVVSVLVRSGSLTSWNPWVTIANDSGWKTCTTNSGFTALTGAEVPQARLYNGVVYVSGGWSNTGIVANSSYIVGKLPAGIPVPTTGSVNAAIGSSSGAAVGTTIIGTNGDMYVRSSATVGSYYKFNGINYLVA